MGGYRTGERVAVAVAGVLDGAAVRLRDGYGHTDGDGLREAATTGE
jgi:hypothetical protein